MSLLKKFLKSAIGSDADQKKEAKEPQSKYFTTPETPVDERFVKYFKDNGGRFLYCSDMSEVLQNFDNILIENDWYETGVCCFDENLREQFKDYNLQFNSSNDASFFLSNCEYLIGANGSILMSSCQTKELKLHELPDSFIIVAGASQIVETISEGLKGIKNRTSGKIPTNITTIKNFQETGDKDFMSYGSTTKTMYLILLEDFVA